MLHLGLTAHVFALLTLAINANEFLQPWTAGTNKDYSKNQNFSVGVHIITEWVASFSNATIDLWQDNKPGDAQGGPFKTLEVSYNTTVWDWTVTYDGLDPAYNNVFYFTVTQANGSDSFTSHYFNISRAVATTATTTATTTSSSATAASSTTSLSTTSSTAPAASGSTTSPSTVTEAAASYTGTPIGTIAGIVIGIVAGFLLLAGAAWWAWRFKKRRGAAPMAKPSKVDSNQPYFDPEQKVYGGGMNQIHEMDERVEGQVVGLHESGGRPVHELHHSVGPPSD